MHKALSYIGLAKKAGAIELGETNTGAAIRAGKGKVLILASDASENAERRAENFVSGTQIPLVTVPFSKAEISQVSGTAGCSMAAFTEIGLAAVFMASLSESEPSFRQTAELLEQKSKKAQMRKNEALAHEKNKKLGMAAKPAATGKRRKNV